MENDNAEMDDIHESFNEIMDILEMYDARFMQVLELIDTVQTDLRQDIAELRQQIKELNNHGFPPE